MSLLVAEDDADVREAVLESLAALPVKIYTAVNGIESLKIVKSQKITAVLSDIKMPEMDGLEFFSQLRLLGYQTPVVFLTGFSDHEHLLAALRAGAFDFLEKPFKKDHLLKVVELALLVGQKVQSLEDDFTLEGLPSFSDQDLLKKYIKARKEIDLIRYESDLRSWKTKK
jgi:CheY-like chemotaxis protein